ncbi:hypothetical protein P308_29210 [Pseudomonas piscis]|nr:hypothetical protein P308_29210 [Pseudomonas piscis]
MNLAATLLMPASSNRVTQLFDLPATANTKGTYYAPRCAKELA